ncbi:transmembrane protein 176A [Macrotis lagotis]|uniref:transmembrane protein 176A n=1 Tax=Macrotis lagotis TaxID=92651 RepID=UPI003D68DE2C
MVPSEVTVNGVKIDRLETAGTSQPVHINVHIHQESALPELLKAGKSLLKFFVMPPSIPGVNATKQRLQVATWTVQIILGVMSGALGVFFYMGPYWELRYTGAAIWTGVVATSAGIIAIIQEKKKGTWWRFLKVLFTLATISTSIAAIVICASELQHSFYYFKNSCKKNDWSSSFTTSNPETDWKIMRCMIYMNWLHSLIKGIEILALLVWITLLVVTLVPLGFTLLYLCCYGQSILPSEEDVDEKKPLDGELSFASPDKVVESCET